MNNLGWKEFVLLAGALGLGGVGVSNQRDAVAELAKLRETTADIGAAMQVAAAQLQDHDRRILRLEDVGVMRRRQP